MAEIIHRLGIKAPLENVYSAIATIEGLSLWWTEETKASAENESEIEFTFRELSGEIKGRMVMIVESTKVNKSVRWKCRKGPSDWIGTNLTFDLSVQGDQVILLFAHRNWAEATESMGHCSMKWATFLLSLKDFVEKGKGKPAPHDLKIDNWN